MRGVEGLDEKQRLQRLQMPAACAPAALLPRRCLGWGRCQGCSRSGRAGALAQGSTAQRRRRQRRASSSSSGWRAAPSCFAPQRPPGCPDCRAQHAPSPAAASAPHGLRGSPPCWRVAQSGQLSARSASDCLEAAVMCFAASLDMPLALEAAGRPAPGLAAGARETGRFPPQLGRQARTRRRIGPRGRYLMQLARCGARSLAAAPAVGASPRFNAAALSQRTWPVIRCAARSASERPWRFMRVSWPAATTAVPAITVLQGGCARLRPGASCTLRCSGCVLCVWRGARVCREKCV